MENREQNADEITATSKMPLSQSIITLKLQVNQASVSQKCRCFENAVKSIKNKTYNADKPMQRTSNI